MKRRHLVIFVSVTAAMLMVQPTSAEDYNKTGYAQVVPIGPQAGGVADYPPGVLVLGDTIYVADGPMRLWFDMEIGGWAPLRIDTAQVGIDTSGFDNGVGAPLEPAWSVPCSGDQICTDTIGPGSNCYQPMQTCASIYVDESRTNVPDQFIHVASPSNLRAGWTRMPGYRGLLDTGVPYLTATIAIDVPPGAAGVYTIDIDQSDSRSSPSFAVPSNDTAPLTGIAYQFADLHSVRIIVGGACCSMYDCVDDITSGWPECLMAGGGWPVPACFGDCNENGTDDACDLVPDCDDNGIPDTCDLLTGAPDCNGNAVPDACDIASGAASDCDGNQVPDLCDVGYGGPDCNFNGVPDHCELATGDCDGNGVIDVCDDPGASDCNDNAASDACEVARYPGLDCNGNGVSDSCEIAAGTSLDEDGNCVPDECDGPVAISEPTSGTGKSRFISIVPFGSGCRDSIYVRFVSLTPNGVGTKFQSCHGKTRYLGKPRLVWEDESHTTMFLAAQLQGNPYIMELPPTGPIHVYGAGIMPESEYEVVQSCNTALNPNCTSPLTLTTTVWGDVTAPYADDPGAGGQPDFRDISEIVAKFATGVGAPRVAAELEPNVIDLSLALDFKDIAACVMSFLDQPYPLDGPTQCQ